jgi:nitrate reductase delta subunit
MTTKTFKALAALLAYPTDELLAALPEVRAVLDADRRIGRRERRGLDALIDELAASDALGAQERYVDLFDRGRATSLHLFEHVHGESRDRGQAMVELKAIYAQAGLALAGSELPDYLPAMLEFLSLQPPEVAQEMLGDSAHLLRKVGEALVRHHSRYAAVFGALLALIGEKGLRAAPAAAVEEEKPLDEAWIEEPVLFGPAGATGGCGTSATAASVVRFVPRAPHGDVGVPR